MDFRTAHHVAGAVVQRLMAAGKGAHEATVEIVEAASLEVAGRKAGLDPATIATALDPARSVAARTVTGGTAPEQVRRMVGRMTAVLDMDMKQLAAWREGLAKAAADRRAGVRALAGQ